MKAQNDANKEFLKTLFEKSKQAANDELAIRVSDRGHNLFIEIETLLSQLSLKHLTNIIETEYSLPDEFILVIIKVQIILVRNNVR